MAFIELGGRACVRIHVESIRTSDFIGGNLAAFPKFRRYSAGCALKEEFAGDIISFKSLCETRMDSSR